MIRTAGLGRRFGAAWAIRDVNLEVRRGEVLGLLGPNGAGKTTTVRLLTVLIEPTEGGAWVDGLDAATRAERIERYLRLFSLWERRDDAAGTFSKGMKQKLAIARALLHDPAVVFLDEPTAALDPEAAYIVREAIEGLRRSGRTIVLATHNLDEASRLCDRVAFIRGALLRVDSPAELLGTMGARGVDIALSQEPDADLLAAARSVEGVAGVESFDRRLVVSADEPASVTADLIRALVAAGADILEVRERATTLEQAYFEVMGVRPDRDEAA